MKTESFKLIPLFIGAGFFVVIVIAFAVFGMIGGNQDDKHGAYKLAVVEPGDSGREGGGINLLQRFGNNGVLLRENSSAWGVTRETVLYTDGRVTITGGLDELSIDTMLTAEELSVVETAMQDQAIKNPGILPRDEGVVYESVSSVTVYTDDGAITHTSYDGPVQEIMDIINNVALRETESTPE